MRVTESKAWLITGSSRGLGRAFAQAALDAGHRVVATARNPLQLSDLVSNYGDRVRALALDVTSEAQARHAIDTTMGRLEAWMCLSTMPAMAGARHRNDNLRRCQCCGMILSVYIRSESRLLMPDSLRD